MFIYVHVSPSADKQTRNHEKYKDSGSHKGMMVQIIYFCDPNNQGKREDFWMHKLRTIYPERLNIKIINQ